MAEGKIIRRLMPFERNFTQIPNAWIRDKTISLKARGLLHLLMSYEHGFGVSIKKLSEDGHGGPDLILTAVRELEQGGYLIRRTRSTGGRFTADDWELCDPSGLSDPALLGYADAGARAGKSRTVRTATVPENPARTVPENPAPIKNTKEHSKESSKATTDARVSKSERAARSTAETPMPTPCPAGRGFMPCAFSPKTHQCIDCRAPEPGYALIDGELVSIGSGVIA